MQCKGGLREQRVASLSVCLALLLSVVWVFDVHGNMDQVRLRVWCLCVRLCGVFVRLC